MSLLILRHEPFEHLGHFAAVLDELPEAYHYHDLGEPMPQESHKGLIIMGGPMSANDDLSGLREELELIDHTIKQDVPMLGICLGSQLIAKALGARVYRNTQLEIGWQPVWLTDAGKQDALLGGVKSPETFFHWHGDTFDLPAGAEWLAYSEKCRHQAFRYGRRIYGIQFHPEITAEMVADWCAQPVNCGDVATLTAPLNPKASDSRMAAERILSAWLKLF